MFPSSILAQDSSGTDNEILQIQIYNLLKLEESRSKSRERFKHQQEMVKRWFGKHKAGNKEFEVGDRFLSGITGMMRRESTLSFSSYV